MSFLENQNLVPGENEKSPRVDYIDPRMTTHNSACALKGLSSFYDAAKQLKNVFIGFIELQGKDFDNRDSGAWHFSIHSFDHFSCTVSSLVCQIVREKQVILAEPVIVPDYISFTKSNEIQKIRLKI